MKCEANGWFYIEGTNEPATPEAVCAALIPPLRKKYLNRG